MSIFDLDFKRLNYWIIGVNLTGLTLGLFSVIILSGGSSTEVLFILLFITNMLTIAIGLFILVFNIKWYKKNLLWYLIIVSIYYPITSIVVENMLGHIFETKVTFGSPSEHVYKVDKERIDKFLFNNSKMQVDTILYSSDLNQLVVLARESSDVSSFNFYYFFFRSKDNKLKYCQHSEFNYFVGNGNVKSDALFFVKRFTRDKKIEGKVIDFWHNDNYWNGDLNSLE